MTSTSTTTDNVPMTIIVHMTIKPANQARFEELWHEELEDIETTEPPGNIKWHIFRNNRDESDLSIIETFASKEIMDTFFKKPKQEEILAKAMKEGLIEADDSRYYIRIGGTKEW